MWSLGLIASLNLANCLDILGYQGQNHKIGDSIPIQVGKLWSARNQIPYSYFQLDVCLPMKLETQRGGLGSMLLGEVRQRTPYDIRYMKNVDCEILCTRNLTSRALREYETKIDDEYYVTLFADGLQGNIRMRAVDYLKYFDALQYWSADLLSDETRHATDSVLVVGGYPFGLHLDAKAKSDGNSRYLVFNHLDFVIKYNKNEVVEFEITPMSKNWNDYNACDLDSAVGELTWNKSTMNQTVMFTYSVHHGHSPVEFATRWDAYMNAVSGPDQTHLAGIINGFNLTILLSVITATILMRILKRDLTMYNSSMGLETDLESLRNQTGWKLLHGDVFRKPRFAKLMACFLGTGVQLICMMFCVLSLIHLGFINPTKRGLMIQTAIFIFFLLGIPAGYVSARFNRILQPTYNHTLTVTLITAFLYSGICLGMLSLNNIVLWWKASTGHLPVVYMFMLLSLWLFVSVPLVFIGAFIGYRTPDIELPCKPNAIPRMVPELPWYLRSFILCPVGGIIPFSATFGEFMMVANSVWQHKLYFLFGVLFVICVILLATSSLISIIFTYSCISYENHRWWWRSWWSAGFSGVYLFLAFTIYYFAILHTADFASTFMYFGYSAIAAYTVFLVTGSCGTIASFWFLRKIYGAIKLD